MGAPPPHEPPHTPAPPGPVVPLSPWLALMLGEIARKREELERERAEQAQRSSEAGR